jgi:hypothetical protein
MPLQSPPDPISALLYKVFYFVKGVFYTVTKKKKQ